MEFWSKGLGKRSLQIECGSETVVREGEKIELRGEVLPPLNWKYTIHMDAPDWVAFFRVALHPTVVIHLLAPRRWGVLFRAGWHLTLFLLAFCWACVRK